MVGIPETKYAFSDGLGIAYQTLGKGPDVVLVPGFASHLEHAWTYPRLAHFYNRLASFSRLTILDKRGTGLSDRVSPTEIPGIEQRRDDVLAVLDAARIEKASLLAHSDGGPLAILFAATYPHRTEKLVLINTYPKRVSSSEFSAALAPESYQEFVDAVSNQWGEPVGIEILSPGHANDPDFRDWWAAALRASMSPAAARAMVTMNTDIDVTKALPAIHAPTLVLHRQGDMANPLEGARFIASEIDGAELVELPGDEHFPWMGDAEAVLSEIERFTTGVEAAAVSSEVLASLLFTDIVGSTAKAADLGDRRWAALLKTHDGIVESEVAKFGGRAVKHTGDGWLSLFDGPAKAAKCWVSMSRRLSEIELEITGGLHMSEVELTADDVRGVGVHIAARLLTLAKPGELVASSVAHDLSLGSGLEFTDRGVHQLKGVPGSWQAYGLAAT